jgi:superfamily I DNA/RNA helicase
MEHILQADREMFLEHEEDLLAFIFESFPLKSYIELSKPYSEWMSERKDLPDGHEFTKQHKAYYAKQPPNPTFQIYHARDLYAAKMWNHEARLYLYSIAENDNQRDYIRTVQRELTHEEFRNHIEYIRGYPLQPEERIFFFENDLWHLMMGSMGFIFVRDDKIHDIAITMIN